MKKTLFFLLLSLSTMLLYAQKATVLEPDGVTTPRITSVQRNAMVGVKGKVVFDTDTNSLWYHDGGAWKQVSSTGNSNLWNSSGQNIFYSNVVNNNNAASNYTNATNYPIPDGNNSGITSFINIPLTGEVINVDLITISFSIAHTFSTDLKITLISPNGTQIVLVNNFGGSYDFISSNVISINNAAAGGLVTVGGIIPTGTYLPTANSAFFPAGDLNHMTGMDVNGNWALKIQDLIVGDPGNLISWSLSFGANCLGTIGKVGVGKNNPTERLDVLGNTKISGNLKVIGNSIFDSKLGIGTTTPHGLLQFNNENNKRKVILYEIANNDHQFTGLGSDDGSMQYQIINDYSRHVFSAGTGSFTSAELMSILGTGDVGVGTPNPSAYGSGGSNRILEIRNNAGVGVDKQSQVVLSSNGTSGYLGGITWASSSLSGEKRTGFITNVFTSSNGTKLSFFNRSSAGVLNENFYIKEDGNAWLLGTLAQPSDVRLKRNINHLSASLGSLTLLNGYTYHWKDKARDQALQYGLIAQEVQKVYPNLVKEDKNGTLSVNYMGLIPILVESIKELKAENELLKKEFNQRLFKLENNTQTAESKASNAQK